MVSLICESGVTRDPGDGLCQIMVPEVGLLGGGLGASTVPEAPSFSAGGALGPTTPTLASCSPAREILSLASARERPTKLGIRYSGVFEGWPSKRVTFGEVNSVAPAAGTWAIT